MNKRTNSGFVLIELVATLVMIGIIGVFAGFFLYTGINGFITSKRNSETALKAQIAMDRMSTELRDIKSNPAPTFAGKSVTYQGNTLPFTRKLEIENGTEGPGIYLTVNNVKNILLDNVYVPNSSISFSAPNNLDNSADGSKEIGAIKVSFQFIDPKTTFEVSIYPRAFITVP